MQHRMKKLSDDFSRGGELPKFISEGTPGDGQVYLYGKTVWSLDFSHAWLALVKWDKSRPDLESHERQWWFCCYAWVYDGIELDDPRFYEGMSDNVNRGRVYGIDLDHIGQGHGGIGDHANYGLEELINMYGQVCAAIAAKQVQRETERRLRDYQTKQFEKMWEARRT